MAYVIAALMAGLSFLLNKLFLRYIGPITVISLGPITEEAAKTLFAYYLGAGIIDVHMVFGVIEATYDWHQDGGKNLTAPLLSIAGHSLFGAVTAGILFVTGRVWLGLAAGIIVHLAYNVTVVRLVSGKMTKN
ncbi:hypothetical protein [Sporomusa malonica]|uniref:CAAX protease self-immunity n=1 Tax=Sporomusa malonica TaxID=112901 RepID=A0A1W2E4R2_9FIRM|nr:hypothetical protein [Sporomusa malonica]SMD04306.1 hypothetical protein SAMN04488500_12039 [Sporomusa malonica]